MQQTHEDRRREPIRPWRCLPIRTIVRKADGPVCPDGVARARCCSAGGSRNRPAADRAAAGDGDMLKRSPLRRPDVAARASVPVFKPKKCKVCKEEFRPVKKLQAVCGILCSITLGRAQKTKAAAKAAKADRKETREKLEKLKTRSQWLKEAQTAFNEFIRKRDEHLPCISCDRHHAGQYHAGHFLSTGARPELRFDESNVHKQCAPCNSHLHGNLVLYRQQLLARLGAAEVSRLEGPHPPSHLSIDDLKAIKAEFRAKTRELERKS